jgi:hypothetical protein
VEVQAPRAESAGRLDRLRHQQPHVSSVDCRRVSRVSEAATLPPRISSRADEIVRWSRTPRAAANSSCSESYDACWTLGPASGPAGFEQWNDWVIQWRGSPQAKLGYRLRDMSMQTGVPDWTD